MTTGNTAISISTCIVGLLLLAPRTNVIAAVRFTVLLMRRPAPDQPIAAPVVIAVDSTTKHELETARELVDA